MNLPFFIRGVMLSPSMITLPTLSSQSLGGDKERGEKMPKQNIFESLLWKALYLSASISSPATARGSASHAHASISEWTLLSLFVHALCFQVMIMYINSDFFFVKFCCSFLLIGTRIVGHIRPIGKRECQSPENLCSE